MALNFVAIDFETAAPKWGTVCSIGMVRVRDGVITDRYSTLVDPECDFGPIQMRVHGITPLMVAGAPTFPQIAEDVLAFIGDDVLVSHNIPFDGNVLQRVLIKYGLNVPEITTFCTYACALAFLPMLSSYQLPAVCDACDVSITRHHDAAADAEACAGIMISMAKKLEVDSVGQVAAALHLRFGSISQYVVSSPKMSNGKPIYIGKDKAIRARNPFAVLEDLRAVVPDIANEISIDQLKDGKTVAFKVCGSVLFYLTIGGNTTYIKAPAIDDPLNISPRASQYKDGSWKLPADHDLNYDRFVDLMSARCKDLYDANSSFSFGCCNDFRRCSDARRCLKADDPDYRGCLYRKNLEAGRIFYGNNKNI